VIYQGSVGQFATIFRTIPTAVPQGRQSAKQRSGEPAAVRVALPAPPLRAGEGPRGEGRAERILTEFRPDEDDWEPLT
jgi:hypothetical protein